MIAMRTLRVTVSLCACLTLGACDQIDDDDTGFEEDPDDLDDTDVPVGPAPVPGTPDDVPIPPGSTLPGETPPELAPGPVPSPPGEVSPGNVPPPDTEIELPPPDTEVEVPPAPGGPAPGEFLWAADENADAGADAGER